MAQVNNRLNLNDYNLLQDTFISNHTGTTSFENVVVTLPTFLSTLIIQLLLPWHPEKTSEICVQFVCEFIILVLPQLVALTILSDFAGLVIIAQLAVIFCFFTIHSVTRTIDHHQFNQNILNLSKTRVKPFVSHLRGGLLMATAMTILAVDFPIFPRRFAKTEVTGFGLMDLGVGVFVICNAVVDPNVRNCIPNIHKNNIRNAVKGSFILILAGLTRLILTQSVNYHVHQSEYGDHWNFFFTLAFVKITATVICTSISPKLYAFSGVMLIFVYQFLLDRCGLRDYILNEHNLYSHSYLGKIAYANRSGMFSCFGYLGIYLIGVQIGVYIFQERSSLKQWLLFIGNSIGLSFALWCTMMWSHTRFDPVSRRLANATYVLWVVSTGLQQIAFFTTADILSSCIKRVGVMKKKGKRLKSKEQSVLYSSLTLSALNKNGFLYFIIANIATGLVNLTTKTLLTTNTNAITILSVYMFVIQIIVLLCLKWNKTPLKF